MHTRTIMTAAALLALTGCAQGPASDQARGMSAAVVALQGTLGSADKDTRFARALALPQSVTLGSPATVPRSLGFEFSLYVCAGDRAESREARAAARALAELAEAVAQAYGPPSTELGELLARRQARRADTGTAPEAPESSGSAATALSEACERTVRNELTRLEGADPRGLPAIIGVISAVKALLDAGQNLLVMALQYEDRRAREEKLFEYLRSDMLATAMQAALGPCATQTGLEKESGWEIDGKKLQACIDLEENKAQSPLHKNNIEIVLSSQRVGALAVPFERWKTAVGDGRGDLRGRVRLAHPQIHADLADHDEIRRRSVPADSQANLILAYRNLRRIAAGNLTEAEKARVLTDSLRLFVEGATSVGNAVNGVDDAAQKLWKALEML
jgi:hypothetical protein